MFQIMTQFTSLDQVDVDSKTVLVRLDLNVPIQDQSVSDDTRLKRSLPTLRYLLNHNAKVVILSHMGRPKGQVQSKLSLAPIARLLSNYVDCPILFANNCIGSAAHFAINSAPLGSIIVLENLRFHAEEELNDLDFAKQLALLGDLYVNDAFSCSHRSHASVVGITQFIPAVAGLGVEQELAALESVLTAPTRPVMAIVGGSKVSTKLDLLQNLIPKVDYLVLGGGMANTFLLANGQDIGESLAEPDLVESAKTMMSQAETQGCTIILPVDYQSDSGALKIMDIGTKTTEQIKNILNTCKTVIWNGPVGVFEISPFDQGSVCLAKHIAKLTKSGHLISVAGGGDTLACLNKAQVEDQFTYTSTAGGAFLEWLEGKDLPGILALRK